MKGSAMSDGLNDPKDANNQDRGPAPTATENTEQPSAAPAGETAASPAQPPAATPAAPPAQPPAATPAAPQAAEPAAVTASPSTEAAAPVPTPAAPSAAPGGFGRWLRQFFWMDERMATAVRDGYAPGQPGWEEYELARAARTDASQLGESGEGEASALLLNRAAVTLLVAAHLGRASKGLGPDATSEQYAARLGELPLGATLLGAMTEEQKALVTSALSSQGELSLAKLSGAKRSLAARAMASLAKGLGDPLERDVRRVGAVLLMRWLKIAVTTVVVIGGLVLAISKATARPNLALHRPVTVVTPHPVYGKDPSLLVDGDRTNLGFHTIEAQNQNVTIDLGSVQTISRVVVYNRADCCQDRAVPLRIEVGEDTQHLRQVGERTEQFETWKLDFAPTAARYVRLTDLSSKAFHLSEVEVY
jgi:hypothetical protein